MSKLIGVGEGRFATVDDEDFALLSRLTWKVSTMKTQRGAHITVVTPSLGGDSVAMHKIIMGGGRGKYIKHVNGDPFDCRKTNLAFSEEARTRDIVRKQATGYPSAKYLGVVFNPKKKLFQAFLNTGKKLKFLGQSEDEVKAARWYDEAARLQFGPEAKLNFPEAA